MIYSTSSTIVAYPNVVSKNVQICHNVPRQWCVENLPAYQAAQPLWKRGLLGIGPQSLGVKSLGFGGSLPGYRQYGNSRRAPPPGLVAALGLTETVHLGPRDCDLTSYESQSGADGRLMTLEVHAVGGKVLSKSTCGGKTSRWVPW